MRPRWNDRAVARQTFYHEEGNASEDPRTDSKKKMKRTDIKWNLRSRDGNIRLICEKRRQVRITACPPSMWLPIALTTHIKQLTRSSFTISNIYSFFSSIRRIYEKIYNEKKRIFTLLSKLVSFSAIRLLDNLIVSPLKVLKTEAKKKLDSKTVIKQFSVFICNSAQKVWKL